MRTTIILGTRGSKLALAQTEAVKNCLCDAVPGITVESKIIKTKGDQDLKAPLSSFGGRGAFVQALEKALMAGEIDVAVHSLKDLPSKLPAGLILGASPFREDQRDVLIARNGYTLETLPNGSVIGTGSDRRRALIRRKRADLEFTHIRGNIGTRIEKLSRGEYDAIILAAAALKRLNMTSVVTEYLDATDFIPAPCQGAIGVECRAQDSTTIEYLAAIDNPTVRLCVDAERSFIATLDMGCHAPIGVLALPVEDGVSFHAFVEYAPGEYIKKNIVCSRDGLKEATHDLAIDYLETINEKLSKRE